MKIINTKNLSQIIFESKAVKQTQNKKLKDDITKTYTTYYCTIPRPLADYLRDPNNRNCNIDLKELHNYKKIRIRLDGFVAYGMSTVESGEYYDATIAKSDQNGLRLILKKEFVEESGLRENMVILFNIDLRNEEIIMILTGEIKE